MKDEQYEKERSFYFNLIYWFILTLCIIGLIGSFVSCSSYEVVKNTGHPRYEPTKERHHPQPKPKL